MHSKKGALVFKFLAIGDSDVGKTSLVKRLCSNEFSDAESSTIGVEFLTHKVKINNQKIHLQIWDTAGQEKYKSLGKMYYRDAVAVLLVFSIVDSASFEHLEDWYTEARKLCHPNAKMLLVCNKIDLIENRVVSIMHIEQFCKARQLEYIETSAKENSNVEESFQLLARKVLQAVATNEIQLDDAFPQEHIIEPTPERACC